MPIGTLLFAESREQATADVRAAIEVGAELQNAPFQAFVHTNAGGQLLRSGSPKDAEQLLGQGVEFARVSGNVAMEGLALSTLAASYSVRGDPDTMRTFRQAIETTWSHRDVSNCLRAIEYYGLHLFGSGRALESSRVLGFLEERYSLTHPKSSDVLASHRADPAHAESIARGAAMTREEIVSYALSLTEEPPG